MSKVENSGKTEYPKVVPRAEWLKERKGLLAKEKALTRQRDAVNAERRRLPMVRMEKDYIFDSPAGKVRLLDLFGEWLQLIVYHFMFDPSWEEGCPSCSLLVDNIGLSLISTLGKLLSPWSLARPWPRSSLLRAGWAGHFRGTHHSVATLITTFTLRWTRLSLP
jgi:Bacterial protein of unknown function (DUF899)